MVVVNEQMTNFMKMNPDIVVTVERVPSASHYEKKMAETAGKQLPDVWELVPGFGSYWLDRGLLLDVTNYINNDPETNLEDFDQVMVQLLKRGNVIYGIPYDRNAQILYYNKDLLDEAGIPYPDNTWTYETLYEQMKAGKKTLSAKGKDIWGLSCPIPVGWQGMGFLYAMGDPVINNEGKIGVTDKIIPMLEWWQRMMNEGLIPQPEPANPQNVVAAGATTFINGNALFHVGSTNITAFEQVGLNFGAAPTPLGPTGVRGAKIGGAFVISASTAYPDQSYKLQSFLVSEQYTLPYVVAGGGIPARYAGANTYTGIRKEMAEIISDPAYVWMNCVQGSGQIWVLKDTLLQELWINRRTPQQMVSGLVQQGNEILANARDQ
jgi:multiple sugar transport system substrate-binding protein